MRLLDARYSACENVLLIATTRLPTQRSIVAETKTRGQADADSLAAAGSLRRGWLRSVTDPVRRGGQRRGTTRGTSVSESFVQWVLSGHTRGASVQVEHS